jgi:uncharacterized protein
MVLPVEVNGRLPGISFRRGGSILGSEKGRFAMSDNVGIVRKVYECFARHDLAGVLASFGSDCEVEFAGPKSLPFAGKYRGSEGMGEAIQKFIGSADILEFSQDEIHGAGDFVTMLGREHCRCKATGREWETRLVETFVVRDGKIRKFLCMYDTARVADAYAGAR